MKEVASIGIKFIHIENLLDQTCHSHCEIMPQLPLTVDHSKTVVPCLLLPSVEDDEGVGVPCLGEQGGR